MARRKNENKFTGTGLSKTEIKNGKKLFDNYKENYHIEQLSDLQLLQDLVYLEILQIRYKNRIAEIEKNNETAGGKKQSSAYIVKALNENLAQILILKEKLGLFETKKDNDGYLALSRLKEKFKKWLEENQASRTIKCPHCSQMILLKIKTDAWEALKHPFFRDSILGNKPLWKLYKNSKLTKEEVAEILGVAPDYIEWLEKKIYSKDSDYPSK